jgi:predicted Zn-dependent peptidase
MGVDRSRMPALGPDPSFAFPAIRKLALPSGLRIWTVEHRQVPVVAFLLLLPAGSAADPPERHGLAAIAGDLLDEGSGGRSALEVHDALGRIGAQFDVEVGPDATVLSLTTLARHAARGLDLLAEMAIQPRFEQREFDRVRDLRLNRLTQLRDLPSAVADRVFAPLVFRGHPYGHLPIGAEGALRALMLKDVVAFHSRTARPDRATIVAVGDARHDELAEAVAAAFGAWRAGDQPPADATFDAGLAPPPPPPGDRLVFVHRAGAAQSELRLGQVGAARSSPDYHALLVLNMVLGGQFVSRINLNLREDKGFTYGARTAFDFRRGAGPFVLQVSVQSDATVAAVREALGELRGIRGDRPVTAPELQLARAALTRGYPRSFETADQIGRAAAQIALYGLPDDSFTTFVPRVRAVTEDEVTRVAGQYLDPTRVVAVIVGDRERVGPHLSTLDLGAATEVAVA